MSKHTPGPCGGEGGPDARLIAAAPELLEALVELVKQHKNLRAAESYPTVNSAATDAADSAIAKARGES